MDTTRIVRVMMQMFANLDSILGLWLLKSTPQGEKKFPGAREAKVVFWGHGTVSPDGKVWQDFLKEGCLPIGVLGSPLDEHPSADFGDRKAASKSTASLVADELGIRNHPLYKGLIGQVTLADLNGAGEDRMMHLASIVKQMWRDGGDAIEFAFAAFDAIVASQRRFLDAVEYIRSERGFEKRTLGNGLVVIGIDSDNPQIGPASRYCGVAAVSQMRSNGQVLVLVNQKLVRSETATEIARDIRAAELTRRGLSKIAGDCWETLDRPGQLSIVPNWCYQVPGHNMLNGTETAPNVEPTKINPQWLLEIVCRHLEGQTVESTSQVQEEVPAQVVGTSETVASA